MSEHRYWAPPPARDGVVEVGPGLGFDTGATVWAGTVGHLATNLLWWDDGALRIVFDSHESDHLAEHHAADSPETALTALETRALEDLGLPPAALLLRDRTDSPALTTGRIITRIEGPKPLCLALMLTEPARGGRRLAWSVHAAPDLPLARLVEVTRTATAALHPITEPRHG